jgi:hypothetical protein
MIASHTSFLFARLVDRAAVRTMQMGPSRPQSSSEHSARDLSPVCSWSHADTALVLAVSGCGEQDRLGETAACSPRPVGRTPLTSICSLLSNSCVVNPKSAKSLRRKLRHIGASARRVARPAAWSPPLLSDITTDMLNRRWGKKCVDARFARSGGFDMQGGLWYRFRVRLCVKHHYEHPQTLQFQ